MTQLQIVVIIVMTLALLGVLLGLVYRLTRCPTCGGKGNSMRGYTAKVGLRKPKPRSVWTHIDFPGWFDEASDWFNGISSEDAKKRVTEIVEEATRDLASHRYRSPSIGLMQILPAWRNSEH
jgi:hypothetical protein